MVKTVLIIKLAAIGDVVMALPMIRALRTQQPNIKITWLCGKIVAPLLRKIDELDEIIEVDASRLLAGNLLTKIKSLIGVWLRLLGKRFDLVIIGHADARYRLLSLTVRAKSVRSFDRSGKRIWPVPGRHHSHEYIRLATNFDGPDDYLMELPVVSWPLSENLKSELKDKSNLPIVALAPAGAKNILREDIMRRWPLENYILLATKLLDDGYNVILTGAPDDKWICESFAALPVINLVGKTSIVDLVALYGACDVIVTHDSGPLHLAELTGKPIVALFGPTSPYDFGPANEYEKGSHKNKTTIFWGGAQLNCRPCYDGKTFADCHNNVCLKSIKVSQVYDAVTAILIDT